MKGNWDGFAGSNRSNETNGSENNYINGKDYNTANSNNVGTVETVSTIANVHGSPTHSYPNSVIKKYINGNLNSERYYDNDGKAYLDIDYTNHGNPKTHPKFQHEHKITFTGSKMNRE